MTSIKNGVLTTLSIGLLILAAALSFLAIGILTVSRIIVELAVALDPDRKSGR